MKEARFIDKNIESWKRMEELGDLYELSDSETATKDYIKSNNDLSFARTFFPHSNISRFLNGLATKMHTGIYVTDVSPTKEFKLFFTKYIPENAYRMRKYIGVATLLFVIGIAMGFLSSIIEPEYTRSFLGDYYVNMTIENIKAGKPMDVYASMDSGPMFTRISINNILVAFRAFAAGILFSVGAALMLLYNALMVGTFVHLFYSYNLTEVALKTIMVHGSIELSAIILAGAAGLRLGGSFMFPGSLPRLSSFKQGVKESVSLIIGLIPFFVVAGYLESYVTRQSQMPDGLFYSIIALSLILVWGYFVIYPYYLKKSGKISPSDIEISSGLVKGKSAVKFSHKVDGDKELGAA